MQFFSLQLLESCANPSGSKTNIRIEASSEIRTELYKALREVMDIARQGRSQVKSGVFPKVEFSSELGLKNEFKLFPANT